MYPGTGVQVTLLSEVPMLGVPEIHPGARRACVRGYLTHLGVPEMHISGSTQDVYVWWYQAYTWLGHPYVPCPRDSGRVLVSNLYQRSIFLPMKFSFKVGKSVLLTGICFQVPVPPLWTFALRASSRCPDSRAMLELRLASRWTCTTA